MILMKSWESTRIQQAEAKILNRRINYGHLENG